MFLSSFQFMFLLLTVALFACGDGATVYYDLIFTRKFVSPDGFEKSALVVNGELIGPTIEAFVGDTVYVTCVTVAVAGENNNKKTIIYCVALVLIAAIGLLM